jgi:hypothetical protein
MGPGGEGGPGLGSMGNPLEEGSVEMLRDYTGSLGMLE